MIFRRAILLAALIAIVAGQAFGADCLMGRYEPSQSSYTPEKLQLPLVLKWEYVASKFDNNPASPVVANGIVYFASGDRIYAVDLATGALKWRYPAEQALGGSIKGTPAINDGMVYFGASDGNLYCISAETGAFNWAYQTRGSIRCPPVIYEGLVYFGSDDNTLYAISAESGDQPRQFSARDDFSIGVAVGSGMAVVACMDGNAYGVNAGSGKLRWGPYRLPLAPTSTSPVIADNVAVVTVGSKMFGLSVRSGQERWQITLKAEAAATPAVSGYDVYVPCRDKKIYAYSTTGKQPGLKWVKPADMCDVPMSGQVEAGGTSRAASASAGSMPMSSPVIAGDTLWVTGSKGVVAGFSTLDGNLKWRYMFAPSAVNTPSSEYCDASSSPTVAGGALLVLTDDGVLHCFAPEAPDATPPVVFKVTPASGTVMSGAPPIKMSAVLYDIGSGTDYLNVSMTLDGQPVDAKPDFITSSIAYTTDAGAAGKPVKSLSDGIHTVVLSAKDYAGNTLTKDWYFVADSSMPPPRRVAAPVDQGKNTKQPRGKGGRNQPTAPRGYPTPPAPPPPSNMPPPPPPPMPPTPAGGPPPPSGPTSPY